MRRYDIPFDQFQRYEDLKKLVSQIKQVSSSSKLRILEVGGYLASDAQIGYLPVRDFLTSDEVVVTDVKDCNEERYIVASGYELPFSDGSFDLVCAMDVMEHINPQNRIKFLEELNRTSSEYVVIAGPYADKRVEWAESYLHDFVSDVLQTGVPTLEEHLENGLPSLAETEQFFRSKNQACLSIPGSSLKNWIQLMIIKHFLYTVPENDAIQKLTDRYYNLFIYPSDRSESCYRHMLVSARNHSGTLLEGMSESFRLQEQADKADRKLDDFLKLINLVAVHLSGLRPNQRIIELERIVSGQHKVIQDQNQYLEESHGIVKRQQKIMEERDVLVREFKSAAEERLKIIDHQKQEQRNLMRRLEDMQEALDLKEKHIRNLEDFRNKIQSNFIYRTAKKSRRLFGKN